MQTSPEHSGRKGRLSLPGILFYSVIFFSIYSMPGVVRAQNTAAEAALAKAIAAKNYKEAAQQASIAAQAYNTSGKSDKALEFYSQSLSYAKKAGDVPAQYNATMAIGRVYSDQKKYGNAQDNFQAALKLARQLKNKDEEGECLIALAKSYGDAGKPKKAIEPMEQALNLAIEKNDIAFQQECYGLLADYYKAAGDLRKSNEYKGQYNAIVWNKQKEESDRKLTELARQSKKNKDLTVRQMREMAELKDHITQVESEKMATESELQEKKAMLRQTEDSLKIIEEISQKRQLQIDLLNKDKELADVKIREQHARIKNEELLRDSIMAGIVMASVLVAVLIINYRRKLKDNKRIHRQNENIKSSINYAKRIQEAMMPRKDQQEALVSDSFVLFKPRDTVSGDFYWFSELTNGSADRTQDDLAFAAVDCTGHGVPGAFMSMIGINSLNGIINRGITETNTILDTLHTEIRTALRQEVTGNNDGMDVALCIYRKQRKVLEFSGAKNPLVYIQDKTLHQVKGDIHSIGGSKSKPRLSFRKHTIAIDKPTTVYLFSDGYRDQFGGKDNAKFMGKRFNQLLLDVHELPMEEQMKALNKTIEDWKGTGTQTDDILVMGIKLG
jgi:serine phosphatase RsbU (regulator of sigma subunit)